MADLKGLYQEVILDHSKRPHNFRALEGAARADGYNPLCGDKVTVYVKLDGDRISDVSFQGSGCAISTASASILTDSLKGKTRAEADALFDVFHKLVTGKETGNGGRTAQLGKLAVFSGVSEFPARVKCATLAWHTLKSALGGSHDLTTTEGEDGEDLAAR
ncbi:MAG TPA: SUF system NifU family Fe-S cluster assembly protein [Terriglobia bacterium]|nr:SUF system NifU family Fe-S cluster assembly protein [Terriglobia bacterium]